MTKKSQFHFFVDSTKYDTDEASLTGTQIKTIAAFDQSYQLFIEGHGDDADRAVSDSEGFDLNPAGHGVLKFYSVPPATFGKNE